jgi:FliI/YscN family ATPase
MRDAPLRFDAADGWLRSGTVESVAPDHLVIRMPALQPGAVVKVTRADGRPLLARVQSIDKHGAHCTPLERVDGISVLARATSDLARLGAHVGPALLGCAADAWGRGSKSGRSIIASTDPAPLSLAERAPITSALRTGIAAIDAFTPIGLGQRIALAAGAGIGKTTLLRRVVEQADVDARVVALIGERAREAAETIALLEHTHRWPTTTIYCATSEAGPMERFAAAQSAAAQAEWLCSRGRRVLFVLDSLSRVAGAWREMAIAAGEPPAQRGYPPSLVGALARLVERAGARVAGGSITAVFSVLVDADDHFEPVTDAVRALLDGQVSLSRKLAEAGRFPAIDVLRSLSRAMPDIAAPAHKLDAAIVRHALSTLEQAEDLFAIGAFRPGSDAWLDACVAARPSIEQLIFDGEGRGAAHDPVADLADIASRLRAATLQTASAA